MLAAAVAGVAATGCGRLLVAVSCLLRIVSWAPRIAGGIALVVAGRTACGTRRIPVVGRAACGARRICLAHIGPVSGIRRIVSAIRCPACRTSRIIIAAHRRTTPGTSRIGVAALACATSAARRNTVATLGRTACGIRGIRLATVRGAAFGAG